jgi:hypothetical protein
MSFGGEAIPRFRPPRSRNGTERAQAVPASGLAISQGERSQRSRSAMS